MVKIQAARLWLAQRLNQGIARAKQKKRTTAAGILILSLFVSGTAVANHYYKSNAHTLYHVKIDGKDIGTVQSPTQIQTFINSRLNSYRSAFGEIRLSNQIAYDKETSLKETPETKETLDRLKNSITLRTEAEEVLINGKPVGYVKHPEDLQTVLNEIKQQYTPSSGKTDKKNTVRTASVDQPKDTGDSQVSIKEKIAVHQTSAPLDRLLTQEQLRTLLEKGTLEQKRYTVKEGDTLSGIASAYGMSVGDLIHSNPGLTEDSLLSLGQEIVVTAMKPRLTVKTVEKKQEEVTLDYTVDIVPSDELYRGESRVLQQGSAGQKWVTWLIEKENGIEISRKVVDQEVLKEPVAQRVLKGTKVKPSRGDGRFSWPVNGGTITSGYGKRWGRNHVGLDISGASNKTIKAADNGRVIRAGWDDGGYGNCVIIDHGNGYQTLYGHLSAIHVKVGETVEKGEDLGVMGQTGDATGVHLHFEIIKNGVKLNPITYFRG